MEVELIGVPIPFVTAVSIEIVCNRCVTFFCLECIGKPTILADEMIPNCRDLFLAKLNGGLLS